MVEITPPPERAMLSVSKWNEFQKRGRKNAGFLRTEKELSFILELE
jgi:hypothetical protein